MVKGANVFIVIALNELQPMPLLPITVYVPGPTEILGCKIEFVNVLPVHVKLGAPVAVNVDVNPVQTAVAETATATGGAAPTPTLIVVEPVHPPLLPITV